MESVGGRGRPRMRHGHSTPSRGPLRGGEALQAPAKQLAAMERIWERPLPSHLPVHSRRATELWEVTKTKHTRKRRVSTDYLQKVLSVAQTKGDEEWKTEHLRSVVGGWVEGTAA